MTGDQEDPDNDDDNDLASRLSVYPDGSLVISDVRRSDSGWYRCRPGTGLALPSEAKAFLNVTCESFIHSFFLSFFCSFNYAFIPFK